MKIFSLIAVILVFQITSLQTDQVVIYGSNSCSHCIDLKKDLDSVKIEYTFYDVELDKEKEKEMVDLLNKYKSDGYVRFPLVEVNSRQLINGATLLSVQDALKEE